MNEILTLSLDPLLTTLKVERETWSQSDLKYIYLSLSTVRDTGTQPGFPFTVVYSPPLVIHESISIHSSASILTYTLSVMLSMDITTISLNFSPQSSTLMNLNFPAIFLGLYTLLSFPRTNTAIKCPVITFTSFKP